MAADPNRNARKLDLATGNALAVAESCQAVTGATSDHDEREQDEQTGFEIGFRPGSRLLIVLFCGFSCGEGDSSPAPVGLVPTRNAPPEVPVHNGMTGHPGKWSSGPWSRLSTPELSRYSTPPRAGERPGGLRVR